MNDSTQYPFENSTEGQAPKRKNRRPLLILPLILLLVLIGLGIRHFQNKAALPDVLTNPSPESTSAVTSPAPQSEKPESSAVSASTPETTGTTAAPAAAAPSAVPAAAVASAPAPAAEEEESLPPTKRPRKHPHASMNTSSAPSAPLSPSASEAVAEKAPSMDTLNSNPSSEISQAPAPAVAAEPAPPSPPPPSKTFALEDQPLPSKTSLSEEGQLAMNTMPPTAEATSEPAASPILSDAFKLGIAAYRRQDYAAAIAQLNQLPQPTTRQRGNPVRDQYVQGNFLLGLSLLQADRTADAVNAFLTVLDYEKYYPLANMNLGICYVELKQYFKADKAFEAVVRDQGYIDAPVYDDVMQRTKYFWALAWTRMSKATKDADKRSYYQEQALMRWKDYQVWFGKDARYRAENRRADGYVRSLSAL